MKGRGLFAGFVVFVGMVCAVHAGWSEPVFLSELNDWDNGTAANYPAVLNDGSEIYFMRMLYDSSGVPGTRAIFCALRDPNGVYSSVRMVTEIYNGMETDKPWISRDGLRLYYEQIVKPNGYQKVFKMAARNKIGDPWIPIRTLSELHKDFPVSTDTAAGLSPDELTIYWASNRSGIVEERKIYTADRPNIFLPFVNIRLADEFNQLKGGVPYLASDGLEAYISIRNTEGTRLDLYKGSRENPVDLFGNFEPIEELNQYGPVTGGPCLSADGKKIFFFQRRGEPGDVSRMGIFMSVWIEEPYQQVLTCLRQAGHLKRQSMRMVTEAIEKEHQAYLLLHRLRPEEIPGGIDRKDLQQARIKMIQALHREYVARINLQKGLELLIQAMELLRLPEEISEPVS